MSAPPRASHRGYSRPRSQHRKRLTLHRAVVAGCLIVGLILVASVGAWAYVHFRYDQIKRVSVPGLTPVDSGNPFNVLVVGSDSRAGLGDTQAFGSTSQVAGQRSDVTIVMHVDPATHGVSILSIPRDLFVPIAGTNASNRINTAFNSGPDQLVRTIHNDLGIPISHYVLVNFSGFQGLVDSLGGIDLNFPYPSKDAYSGLKITKSGCQLVNGGQALAVARSRHFYYLADGYWHYDGSSDLGRIRRQHVFLHAVMSRALSEGLTNPIKANSFIGAAVHDVTIDDSLNVADLVGLARDFRSLDAAGVPTYTYPTRAVTNYQGFGDVLFPVQPDGDQLVAKFLGQGGAATSAPTTVPPSSISLSVLNGTSVSGLAAKTAASLKNLGYRVGDVGNAGSYAARTVITYPPGQLGEAKTVQGVVGGGAEVQQGSSAGLTLVLGSQFTGIQAPQSSAQAPSAASDLAPTPSQPFDPQVC